MALLQTVAWRNKALVLIDQTQLPRQLKYITCRNVKHAWGAIRRLSVRGAPAIGAAAAFGLILGVQGRDWRTRAELLRQSRRVRDYLISSRPTAVNLSWAVNRVFKVVESATETQPRELVRMMLQEALAIWEEDRQICRRMAQAAQPLIRDRDRILTICNTGSLATVDYGTALGAVFRAWETGKRVSVYACETRPLLQGARLTCWELQRRKIPVTLITDSMAAYVMKQGLVDKVFAGADRIAANGDTANKIGTYSLAVAARFHRLPFYIVAPRSTFDAAVADGASIPIEQRDPEEIRSQFFKRPIAPRTVAVYNPAFDVVPRALISAIVCERGILKPPYTATIRRSVR